MPLADSTGWPLRRASHIGGCFAWARVFPLPVHLDRVGLCPARPLAWAARALTLWGCRAAPDLAHPVPCALASPGVVVQTWAAHRPRFVVAVHVVQAVQAVQEALPAAWVQGFGAEHPGARVPCLAKALSAVAAAARVLAWVKALAGCLALALAAAPESHGAGSGSSDSGSTAAVLRQGNGHPNTAVGRWARVQAGERSGDPTHSSHGAAAPSWGPNTHPNEGAHSTPSCESIWVDPGNNEQGFEAHTKAHTPGPPTPKVRCTKS
jgi:hypothetical protein